MPIKFDVIVVGSGPAGVSASFPLVRAGLHVLMVDGGNIQKTALPSKSFLHERMESVDQWKWMIGENFHASRYMDSVSPKLRVPTHDYVFENFLEANKISPKGFVAIGSLAKGGLSNAWGCGVARLSKEELSKFPFPETDILTSYENVSLRIGISGGHDDDLSEYFGLDRWSQPPIEMDHLHNTLYAKYQRRRECLIKADFRMGRSRVAALSRDQGTRKACDLLGNCLWGCDRKSLYSSAAEIPDLLKFGNFTYEPGVIVDHILNEGDEIVIGGVHKKTAVRRTAKKIILAAGSLASTRLALQLLGHHEPVPVQSCPTGAFLLWMPRALGSPRKDTFGLGQLTYSLKVSDEVTAFGSTFSTTGIPISEFAPHLPVGRRFGIDILRHLLSSCVVGNTFLPGHLSTTTAVLGADNHLRIEGGYREDVKPLLQLTAQRLRNAYRQLGAYMLPMSFTMGTPGGDIHYSGTLPMRSDPKLGETAPDGSLFGASNVYLADASSLPRLTEKSHTLTIMANADRIGRGLVSKFRINEMARRDL